MAYFSSNSYSFKYFFFQKIFQVTNLYNCKYFWKYNDEILKFFKELKYFEAMSQQTSYLQHYGTVPVDPCRPQNRGSHDYLQAHKGSRGMSRPLIQDSSVSVLFP